MKPNLLNADSFLIFNSLSSLTRNSIPFPRNSIPLPNHFLSVISPHPNSSRPSRLIPICSSSNPTRKQSTSTNEQVSLNSNVEVLGADELERNLNVQVGNPIVPNYIQSWTKLSLSDQAFFLLSFIACTTSIAFTSLVVAAVPTLYVSYLTLHLSAVLLS
ncbi:hypothetical protein H0E87_031685 [Populus deltoides]|uniref:Transmembrane protein n=1 Tax=Populus deltoides TaxID=3696 RepID=A0A8T2WAA0_POPDE|nr:hypothetical protein H0E87_031685 [Populus deltoides]